MTPSATESMRLEDRIIGPVTVRSVAIVAAAFAMVFIVYYVPQLIGQVCPLIDPSLPIDAQIPFLPWTSAFYLTCYLLWVANYFIAALDTEDRARTFFTSDFIVKAITMACFILIPATIVRPEITGTGFWDDVMRHIYSADSPTCLLPSMHCSLCWFCWIAVRDNERIPKWYRWFTLAFAIIVCVSTLTTKQHYLMDGVVAIILAETVYQCVKAYRRRSGQAAGQQS